LCHQQSVSSLGFDELQPSSEGIDNEDDSELQYEGEAEAEAPPKKVLSFKFLFRVSSVVPLTAL
jgi:hypothetical protein